MESSECNDAYISPPFFTNRLIFGKGALFYLVLSEYTNQSNATGAKRGKIRCTASAKRSCLLLLVLCLIGCENAKKLA